MLRLGSLFSGSGGFELAGTLCGITPIWSSEIEPYPIAVTRSRFPNMKHLGSVTDVKGNEVEPVDVITFGSPCQDLSVAGKRAGLKHTENGDDETTRSGLFMEAVRIIKEMREATNGRYPAFAVWENVPGAFSSNKGEDFRVVLEEIIKIVEPTAVMPSVPKGGWPYADVYCGDGWSISYRVIDAQHFGKTIRDGDSGSVLVRGTPQRRRRIYLVADFRGECAGKILFEREGLRGHFAESRTPWESLAGDAENRVGAADREGGCVSAYGWPLGFRPENVRVYEETATTICNGTRPGFTTGVIVEETIPYTPQIRSGVEVDSAGKAAGKGALIQENLSATLGTAQDQYLFQPMVMEPVLMDAYQHHGWRKNSVCGTLTAGQNDGVRGDTPLVCEPVCSSGEVAGTLDASYYKGCGMRQGVEREYVVERHLFENHSQDSRYGVAYWDGGQIAGTLTANNANGAQRMPDKDNFNCVIALDRAFYNQGKNAQDEPQFYDDGTVPTLVAKGPGAVCVRYIVRRLTPTECARLQGFPDKWGHPDIKDALTDEEYAFWLNVRNTHAAINGKAVKDYTKEQMLKWYNDLHTDSAEYKMWGNGIALPCALYVMQGIAEVLNEN